MGGRVRHSTKTAAPVGINATPGKALAIHELLRELYPNATVELDHTNAYQLLVATILAAQSNDKTINTITPALFARYPDAHALAQADAAELEPLVFKSGFFRAKAGYLMKMARALVERHGGEVPRTMAELTALPGVARKTANVVLGCALDINEGIVVDTHVTRLVDRLGLSHQTDPVKIEAELVAIVPRPEWARFAHGLIWHGRRVCDAKAPNCEHCSLAPLCPSAGTAVVDAKARAIDATKRGAETRKANAKVAKPAPPAQREKPTPPTKPAQRAKLAQPAKLKSAQPAQPAKVKSAQPAQPTKPTKPKPAKKPPRA